MATHEAPFALSRCTENDMAELVALLYECFPPDIRTLMMGCSTPQKPGELSLITEKYIKRMRQDPNDFWIGVKDTAAGKWVAGTNWKVFLSGTGGTRDADSPPEWLEGEPLEKSRNFVNRMSEAKNRLMPGPFVHLHICFTDAKYRRRGAGWMMLQWGCDLMDLLFLPGYIEASTEGNFLYKAFGFYDLSKADADFGEGAVAMRRDARRAPILGGKVRPVNQTNGVSS